LDTSWCPTTGTVRCSTNQGFGIGFCCQHGDLRAAGTADSAGTVSLHCGRKANPVTTWGIYELEYDRTRYSFRVTINRPRLDAEGFLSDMETTWYIDSDVAQRVVTSPERDDPSSLEYVPHREVLEMSASGLLDKSLLRPLTSTDDSMVSENFVHNAVLLPHEFVDLTGETCATGVTKAGFMDQADFCHLDAGFCNDKQVQLLWEADVARGEPDASEYWIRGFCQDTAYTFEEDDTTFLSCPFPVDFYSEVKINIPVLEEDLAMSEFVVTEKSCSDTCPNLFDIVCFVDNSCWRPIIIVVFLLTFSCVGVCLLVFLFMKKHKSLEQHVKNMRKSKEDRQAMTSSMGGANNSPMPVGSSWSTMAPPQMVSGASMNLPSQMSQCGALPMGSQFQAPVLSQGGAPMGAPMCAASLRGGW